MMIDLIQQKNPIGFGGRRSKVMVTCTKCKNSVCSVTSSILKIVLKLHMMIAPVEKKSPVVICLSSSKVMVTVAWKAKMVYVK